MQIGDTIAINLATAYNPVAGNIASRGCMAEVTAVTEKAVKVEAKTHNGKVMAVWFPKKALVMTWEAPDQNHKVLGAKLAPWFKADSYTQNFLIYAGAC